MSGFHIFVEKFTTPMNRMIAVSDRIEWKRSRGVEWMCRQNAEEEIERSKFPEVAVFPSTESTIPHIMASSFFRS